MTIEGISSICSAVGGLRSTGLVRTLSLPFEGRWTVWQGIDGNWTHQGPWRWAFDFVKTDEEGLTHRDSGLELAEFYAFGLPVLSPCRGRVAKVVDGLPDHPVWRPNQEHPWGNLVVIEHPDGWFVLLGHLARGSIQVEMGALVEPGMVLGSCGNSGYSLQPHLHIQVQATDEIGAATLPFSFVRYLEGVFFLVE